VLRPQERQIVQTGILLKQQADLTPTDFDRFSALLFNWAARLIAK